MFELRIEDDGRGFDQAGLPSRGHGLRNMRERMTRLGGCLQITSEPGAGTQLTFSIPLAPITPNLSTAEEADGGRARAAG